MKGLYRVGAAAAGFIVGLAGCRHTCGDQSRYQNCDPCTRPRAVAAPRVAAPCPTCDGVVSAAPPTISAGGPVTGIPTGLIPGPFTPPPFGGVPYAPAVPTPPPANELPLPSETIPPQGVPLPSGPTSANGVSAPGGAIPPVSRPVTLPR